MDKTWSDIFAPVTAADPSKQSRSQQQIAGDAVLEAFRSGKPLVLEAPTGTGKSLAVLIPMIEMVTSLSTKENKVRAVVSTETTALQDQYVKKDLPFLAAIYPGFTYRCLKGRSHYLCYNAAKLNSRGNTSVANMVRILEAHPAALGDGERGDCERVLRHELTDKEWKFLVGSTRGCSDNKCLPDECFSARARALALNANIVVVSHAMLRVDAETRSEDGIAENFLGPFDYLAVDEAHTLEQTLVDGWTEEVTEWELVDAAGSISEAISRGQGIMPNAGLAYTSQGAVDDFTDYLSSITRFFGYIHKDEPWGRVVDSLSIKYVRGGGPAIVKAMADYEEEGPKRLKNVIDTFEKVEKYLKDVRNDMLANETKGTRKVTKGLTAAKYLGGLSRKLLAAMETKDGVINDYGVPTIVTASGIEKRNGETSVRISAVPLDISERAKTIWAHRNVVLLSATLRDLTDGSFRYLKTSLGIGEDTTDTVTASPFDYHQAQVVYVTPATAPVVDIPGARYNFEELVELLEASSGRALVLFTARAELDDAAYRIRQLRAAGQFHHKILVQEKESNKSKLIKEFQDDTSSVFFATKSLFTGVDVPGDSCSLVVLCIPAVRGTDRARTGSCLVQESQVFTHVACHLG